MSRRSLDLLFEAISRSPASEEERYCLSRFSLRLDNEQMRQLLDMLTEAPEQAEALAVNLQRKQKAMDDDDHAALSDVFREEDVALARLEIGAIAN